MSSNNTSLLRYITYDKCLRKTERKWKWTDLQSEANKVLNEQGHKGIGKTQFYADIQYLIESDWEVPIKREKIGRTVYFSYEDPNYTLNNNPLNETEKAQLEDSLLILSRFKNQPEKQWENNISQSIQSVLQPSKTDKPLVAKTSPIPETQAQIITDIQNAITQKTALITTCQKFNQPLKKEIELHPAFLKEYNNRWFVFGYNATADKRVWNIAVDLIQSYKTSLNNYVETDVNWDDYFSTIVGVTKKSGEPMVIDLLVNNPDLIPHLQITPLHASQLPFEETPFGFTTQIKVIPNPELEQRLLSYGEQIKILSPILYRIRIAERFKQSAALYE